MIHHPGIQLDGAKESTPGDVRWVDDGAGTDHVQVPGTVVCVIPHEHVGHDAGVEQGRDTQDGGRRREVQRLHRSDREIEGDDGGHRGVITTVDVL